jgi:acyl carrier protein
MAGAYAGGQLSAKTQPADSDNKGRMTETEALAWIAEVFEEKPSQLAPDTPRNAIPAWDSLGILTLMASLDSDFGIMLDDGEITGMKKVGDVLDLLRRNGRLA